VQNVGARGFFSAPKESSSTGIPDLSRRILKSRNAFAIASEGNSNQIKSSPESGLLVLRWGKTTNQQGSNKMKFTPLLSQHGKEIERDGSSLMDEIFVNFSLMAENYIYGDQIEKYFLATHKEAFTQKEEIVGFLAVGYCGRTLLLQVSDEHQRKGIASSLVKFAVEKGCRKAWLPRQDGCDEFWEKIADWRVDRSCAAR